MTPWLNALKSWRNTQTSAEKYWLCGLRQTHKVTGIPTQSWWPGLQYQFLVDLAFNSIQNEKHKLRKHFLYVCNICIGTSLSWNCPCLQLSQHETIVHFQWAHIFSFCLKWNFSDDFGQNPADSGSWMYRWMHRSVSALPIQSNDRLAAALGVCLCSDVITHWSIPAVRDRWSPLDADSLDPCAII